MKAVLIAAGLGTRLRPLTNTIPKCMIPIGPQPLLWYHTMLLKHYGITDIWINTHWLEDQVKNFFGDGSKFGVNISYSHETQLLGTSGALTNPDTDISRSLSQDKEFLIIYADNLINFNFNKFIAFHRTHKSFMTIAVNRSEEPWTKGVIEINSDCKIIKVVEKPPKEEVKSDLTNAGIYLCNSKILSSIPLGYSDFPRDIIPKLLIAKKPLYAYLMPDYLQDTGTPERYAKAQADLPSLKFPFTFQ